jgi:uncharacterized protein YdeI (YjbR/CyaY-like superfamily)
VKSSLELMAAKSKPKRDSRVEAYISSAPDFAKPILIHLREVVHQGCPEVEETMKWSRPHFIHHGMLCGMSAFQHHCAFGFWMGDMVLGEACQPGTEKNGMGHFGRITSLADLPSDKQLLAFIRKAVELNESGAKRRVTRRPAGDRELAIPDCITAALKKNPKAKAVFESFPYSHKKEYVEWITEAKREETRERRIETMLIWLAEGKSRNWKYAHC